MAGDVLPFDERVVVRPRSGWISRRELSLQIKCCDCLVAWHDEGHYLTSGLVADAIGAGIPMLVNGEWQFWREVLGEAALTYIGESGLKAAFANLTPGFIAQRGLAAAELRPKFDWSRIANETARLLLDTLSNRN